VGLLARAIDRGLGIGAGDMSTPIGVGYAAYGQIERGASLAGLPVTTRVGAADRGGVGLRAADQRVHRDAAAAGVPAESDGGRTATSRTRCTSCCTTRRTRRR
jgi:hypothetical protein